MRVEEFSLFFGRILVRLGKRGDTEYNIRSIPAGGFVRIAGMEADDISGGKPILEAIRDPAFGDAQGMTSVIRQLDADTMADISAENISPEVRTMLAGAVGADGLLTAEGRADLLAKHHSPQLTTDEHKLIDMLLAADTRATDPGLYSNKPIYKRALAIFAGPLASLLFGYLVFCLMGMVVGLPSGKQTNQIQVMPNGVAGEAGLRTGDRIIAINDQPTTDGKALVEILQKSPGKSLTLTLDRAGETLKLPIIPRAEDKKTGSLVTYDSDGKPTTKDGKPVEEVVGRIGVFPLPELVRENILESIQSGTYQTLGSIKQLFETVFSRKVKDNVGGPIAMGQMTTSLQKLGIPYLLMMMGQLSLSLGIMNLLPIPILDGGHLLLLAIEKLRRRKLSPREVYRAQMVGLGMIALLICFVMFNDITRLLSGKGFQ